MNSSLGTLLLLAACGAAPEQYQVLNPQREAVPPSAVLQQVLRRQIHQALDQRREGYERRTSVDQWKAYQQETRAFFLRQLGGLPERTPLNARVVGTLQGDGYRVEKVLYESRPHHPVTAVLYLPDAEPPFPAVLIACGHSSTGKAAGYNQQLGIHLARNGLAALCYDPIGQGERFQILEDGRPKLGSTTQEHFLIGVGSILLGTNTAQYRIWDGMRGIDYLQSREDIDGSRIGCTGCSGGGTLTSYLMALDDRVTSAAPACYITTFRRLIDTIGPQDAEQNIFGQLRFGMDQPDYLLMRAPKPTLICATTEDFFDIQGTWDAFRQSKRVYTRFGYPERVSLVEADGKHGIPPLGRAAMVQWMRRWLLNVDQPVEAADLPTWSVDQLQCTPDGQVNLLPGVKSVYDLNAEREQQLAAQREAFWKTTPADAARNRIRSLAAIRPLDDLPAPDVERSQGPASDAYRLEKLVLRRASGMPLPALLLVPQQPTAASVLYLHGRGKQAEVGDQGELHRLATAGHRVLAVDLSGLGETGSGSPAGRLGAWKEFYLAYLLGQSLVGIRAEDTLLAARFLRSESQTENPAPVQLIASGEAGIPALHAAALHPELFSQLTLRDTVTSWAEVVRTPEAENQLVGTVHAALTVYDLPNLESLLGRERVTRE